MPEPEPKSEPKSEPTPEPQPEPEPKPEPEPEPEPFSEPEPKPDPNPDVELRLNSQDLNMSDSRNKRVAMHTLDGFDFKNLGNDVTVKTSISYKVSSSKGWYLFFLYIYKKNISFCLHI